MRVVAEGAVTLPFFAENRAGHRSCSRRTAAPCRGGLQNTAAGRTEISRTAPVRVCVAAWQPPLSQAAPPPAGNAQPRRTTVAYRYKRGRGGFTPTHRLRVGCVLHKQHTCLVVWARQSHRRVDVRREGRVCVGTERPPPAISASVLASGVAASRADSTTQWGSQLSDARHTHHSSMAVATCAPLIANHTSTCCAAAAAPPPLRTSPQLTLSPFLHG
jgi:hypothetical protein